MRTDIYLKLKSVWLTIKEHQPVTAREVSERSGLSINIVHSHLKLLWRQQIISHQLPKDGPWKYIVGENNHNFSSSALGLKQDDRLSREDLKSLFNIIEALHRGGANAMQQKLVAELLERQYFQSGARK